MVMSITTGRSGPPRFPAKFTAKLVNTTGVLRAGLVPARAENPCTRKLASLCRAHTESETQTQTKTSAAILCCMRSSAAVLCCVVSAALRSIAVGFSVLRSCATRSFHMLRSPLCCCSSPANIFCHPLLPPPLLCGPLLQPFVASHCPAATSRRLRPPAAGAGGCGAALLNAQWQGTATARSCAASH